MGYGGDIYCDRRLDDATIRHGLSQAFDVPADQVGIFHSDSWADRPPDDRSVYCRCEERAPAEFFFLLDIAVFGEHPDAHRGYFPREMAARFCATVGCRGITSDDSSNPWRWVLADQTGTLMVVKLTYESLDDGNGFDLADGGREHEALLELEPPVPEAMLKTHFAHLLNLPPHQVGINQKDCWPADIVVNLELSSSSISESASTVRIWRRLPAPWKRAPAAAQDWIVLTSALCQRLQCTAQLSHGGLSSLVGNVRALIGPDGLRREV